LLCSGALSVLQCVAVCCSVLQCVAVCCNVLQCVAVCCSVFIIVQTDDLGLYSRRRPISTYNVCVCVCLSVCLSICACVYVRASRLPALHTSKLTHIKVDTRNTTIINVVTKRCEWKWVAVCCSVLQRAAACCRALNISNGTHAMQPSQMWWPKGVSERVLQSVAACCSVLQRVVGR